MLHRKQENNNQNDNISSAKQNTAKVSQNNSIQSADMPSTSQNVRAFHTSVSSKTMLATAWVNIIKDGSPYKVRALIDPCSDDTFISKDFRNY